VLGLKHNVNLLVDYDPTWPSEFIAERRRISEALGTMAKGIEHYGSTSVPGMRAKPIMDILVGVKPFDDWEKCRVPLETLGYDYVADAGIPDHYIFGRGRVPTERSYLVHVVEFLGGSWLSDLAFRDALINDESLRLEYLELKERSVAAAPEGRAKYNELKADFLARVKANLTH
jgi:GrpB-like predicted nucleotidyltransferase (UPF0157 family)